MAKNEKHSIGKTIAALRKEKGWTQAELAERLQVSDKTVSKWEKDSGAPSLEFFPVLAELFGVSIDYLMTGKVQEKEVITMSKAELCAKNDDVSLLKGINVDHKDENGKTLVEYAKLEKEKNDDLLAKAQIKHSTGVDLVNIYFQPCCNNYAKTEIELYLAKGIFEQHHGCVPYTPAMIGGQIEQLIGKYVIEDGSLFKSISGLAKRVYGYKVRQFDTNGKILFQSDFAFFSIK